jgi:hypothetical protein
MAARAMRETQVHAEYARSRPLCSTVVRSITLAGAPNFTSSQFRPCNRGMNAMTCNTIEH